MTAESGAPVALVADDDSVIRRVLTMVLERQGFHVLTAADGEGALAQAAAGQPRVIFLDARMPAPDGFEVCQLLRAERLVRPEPLVIMLTAAGQESDRRKAASVGVNEFLTKPFSPSKLAARLQLLASEIKTRGPQEEARVWEPEVLRTLAQQMGDAGGTMREEIISLFLTQGRALANRLRAAAEASDTVTIRDVAHSLRESTLTVGGARLAMLCEWIEASESEVDAKDAARAVPQEFEKLADQLSGRVWASSPSPSQGGLR